MKIVHLVAGAGGMYCGSCMHGNTLAAALQRAGCEAVLVPAYTPLRTDEQNVSIQHVVYGGVNVYLQQLWPGFRHMPRWLGRLLDRPGLLNRLARRGSTTRPDDLGPLCVSMLRGEEGRQRAELDKLVDWLAEEVRPELVHLNNALLVGMARQIARRLGVPVVCDLSGEDSFVEKLPEPHYAQVRALLTERCGELAGMIAMNDYYAQFMAGYLEVPRERIHVVRPGLNLEGFPAEARRPAAEPITIGFLGRVCEDKGLHVLADAFGRLCEDSTLPPLRLEAAGYLAPGQRSYLAEIEAGLRGRGLGERFGYRGELDRPGKIEYLRGLTVLAAPAVFPEAKGLPVLESWAAGTPVVVPREGAFPEMIQQCGGGLLHAPGDAGELAGALRQIVAQPQLAAELGRRGHAAVHQHHTAEQMARRTIAIYESICRAASRC